MYKNNLLSFNPKNLVFNAKIYPEQIEISRRTNNTFYDKIIGVQKIKINVQKNNKNEI